MRHFGIIGKPLGHSQSKKFFDNLFATRHIDADYTIHELEAIDEVVPLLSLLDGFHVTSPYKEAILPYLNEIDPVAKEIGAVNVVYANHGYNTDYAGAIAALKPHLRPTDKQALVLGLGGAARAVRYAMEKAGLKVTIVSRKKGKGDMTYDELTKEVIDAHTVIANCTPLGMRPRECEKPDIPYEYISSKHILFDCIYNPEKTKFLEAGEQQGATIINGEQMFSAQAVEAIKIFRI